MTFCRCMVHALPSGGAYDVGASNGMAGAGREQAQREAASPAVRYAQMLDGPEHT